MIKTNKFSAKAFKYKLSKVSNFVSDVNTYEFITGSNQLYTFICVKIDFFGIFLYWTYNFTHFNLTDFTYKFSIDIKRYYASARSKNSSLLFVSKQLTNRAYFDNGQYALLRDININSNKIANYLSSTNNNNYDMLKHSMEIDIISEFKK